MALNLIRLKSGKRYSELKLLVKAGVIYGLELQKKYTLLDKFVFNGEKHREIIYKADFVYWDTEKQCIVIEDVKGYKTKEYNIKKKLLLNMLKDDDVCYEFLEI